MDDNSVKISPHLISLVEELEKAGCSPETTETGMVRSKCPTCMNECLNLLPSNDPPYILFCANGNHCTKSRVEHAIRKIIRTKYGSRRKSLNGTGEQSPQGYTHIFLRSETRDSEILNTALAIEEIELRWNTRADHREIRQEDGDWIPATQRTINALRQTISENYGVKKNPKCEIKPLKWYNTDWKVLLNAHDCKHEVDPFKLWLESLPPWDGEERINTLLARTFMEHRFSPVNSLTSEFGKWASRFPFIAAIQLAYMAGSPNPKDQIHTRPLLVGASGIGKSQYLKSLLPHNKGWFTDSFTVSEDEKKMVEVLLGCVIAEWSEMTGLTPKSLLKWKAFSTSSSSRVRLAYREDAENYIRNVVIIGTTNDLRCIPNDPAGWRRDLPILLGYAPQAVEPYIMSQREQMWAEGMHQFNKGVRADIPHEMREEAMKHSERFRKRIDPVEDAVGKLPPTFELTTTSDLMVKAGLVLKKQDIHNMSAQKITHFVDMLYRAGCREARTKGENGGWICGWERKEKP